MPGLNTPLPATESLSVSEYASRLGQALRAVGPATIEGEVQKPKRSPSGMLWFTVTDGDAVLSCKVFRGQVRRLEHTPREGDLVQVDVERPDLWAQAGKLDLIVGQVRLAGEGELLRRRQELIARLRAEGLCDEARRRPLPPFPRAVGIVAGRGSDAMADVIQALRDRWQAVHMVTCPSLVQGKAAPAELIDALARMQEHPLVDTVILARGGGSVQDLACFDDERLCRAIFACEAPVVCAVGHTENDPVCNRVSWPAYTPSRSAELVVPSTAEVRSQLAFAGRRLEGLRGELELAGERLEGTGRRLDSVAAIERRAIQLRERAQPLRDAPAILAGVSNDVQERSLRLERGVRRQLSDHSRDYRQALTRLGRASRRGADRQARTMRELLERQAGVLAERSQRALSEARREALHLTRLIAAHDFRRRGWILAHGERGPVRSSEDLAVGGHIELELHDGRARAAVTEVSASEPQSTNRRSTET